ncbi:hypothetical protein XENOCAPTIV_001825 [Xenoophorus captivus]|uniref:Uncharacterized protein n=1 Tax=Xenoophorus captivus TaxID=1517983 RepID=A0ABV0R6B2_9TELE
MPGSLTMARTAADVFLDMPGNHQLQKAEILLSNIQLCTHLRHPRLTISTDTQSSTSGRSPCASGEKCPIWTRGFTFTLSSRQENFINCIERPADQIHNSEFGRYAKRGSKKERQDTELKQGRHGRVRETEKIVLLHREQKEKENKTKNFGSVVFSVNLAHYCEYF